MTAPESQVLDTIAELEAEENPDDITELVRWQLEQGVGRGEHLPEYSLFFQVPNAEELERWRIQMERLREAARVVVPEDAPYQEHRKFEPGERVGWTDENGRVHIGVVKAHVEDPPKSGNWTLEFEPDAG